MDLTKYTENDFISSPISGSGNGLAEILIAESAVDPYTSGSVPDSGSWPYITGDSMIWNEEVRGNISSGSVVGVKVMLNDITGGNNRRSFQMCNSLAFTISAGSGANFKSQTVLLDILSREFHKGYVYFKVNYPLTSFLNTRILFRKSDEGSDSKFEGYECNADAGKSPITFVVEPYFSAEENSVFNPLINNAVEGTLSSIAKRVDIGSGRFYTWEFENTYNGGDAHASGSQTATYDGMSASWTSSDPIHTLDGDRMQVRFYPVPVLVRFAEIPDYFFTSMAYLSGRSLGSKTGYELKTGVVSSSIIKEFISNYTGKYTVKDEGAENKPARKLAVDTLDLLSANVGKISSSASKFEISFSGTGSISGTLEGVFTSGSFTGSFNGEEVTQSLWDYQSGSLVGIFSGSFAGYADPSFSADFLTSPLTESKTIFEISEVGVDPAFMAAQEFLGSAYTIDAEDIPAIEDMVFETVKFVPGVTYESAMRGPGEVLKNLYRRTYIRSHNSVDGHAASLPIVGDTIYSADLSKRLPNSKIFIQETSQVLLTDEFATVISISSGSTP